MKVFPLHELYSMDFSVSAITVMKQSVVFLPSFSCIDNPKQKNMFVYLDGCSARYTFKDESVLCARSGDIIYNPIGSQYSVEFCAHTKDASTIGINFLLKDDFQSFCLNDKTTIINADNENYKSMFYKISEYGEAVPVNMIKVKELLYSILSSLCRYYKKSYISKYDIIKKGIQYLEENTDQTLSVSEIAAMCNVSEIYFRKLFKKYSGMSPHEFRTNTKICRAKNYLEHGIPISEIAEILGFSDASYFIRLFREKVGTTPHKYRLEQR